MPKPRGRACFAEETLPRFVVGRNASVDDLKSHCISQDRVEGLKRDAHRAPTQLHRRAVGVGSDMIVVKALRVCTCNFLLVPCQLQ